ncbi:MAG: aminotransferase class IV [Bacteroidota bacterium]
MQPLVYINEEYIFAAEARVSAFDAGFLFGAGVFETVLVRAGKPFYFSRHFQRLRTSCEELGINFPHTEEKLREILSELITRNNLAGIETRAKILITPGDTSAHISHRDGTLFISAMPYIRPSLHIPWKLLMPGVVQASAAAPHKTTSYMGYRMALHAAHEKGYDDLILFDRLGHVSETSVASLILFRGESLMLPASPDALRGITRSVIVEIAKDRGMEVVEAPVSPHELGEGFSVCVCSALLGPFPVGRINENEIPLPDPLFLSSLRESWEERA